MPGETFDIRFQTSADTAAAEKVTNATNQLALSLARAKKEGEEFRQMLAANEKEAAALSQQLAEVAEQQLAAMSKGAGDNYRDFDQARLASASGGSLTSAGAWAEEVERVK